MIVPLTANIKITTCRNCFGYTFEVDPITGMLMAEESIEHYGECQMLNNRESIMHQTLHVTSADNKDIQALVIQSTVQFLELQNLDSCDIIVNLVTCLLFPTPYYKRSCVGVG